MWHLTTWGLTEWAFAGPIWAPAGPVWAPAGPIWAPAGPVCAPAAHPRATPVNQTSPWRTFSETQRQEVGKNGMGGRGQRGRISRQRLHTGLVDGGAERAQWSQENLEKRVQECLGVYISRADSQRKPKRRVSSELNQTLTQETWI